MIYTLNRLRDKQGRSIQKPVGLKAVTLDLDRNRMAQAFQEEKLVGELRVMEFEAHAKGLYLRGWESDDGGETALYQEWFLAYPQLEKR